MLLTIFPKPLKAQVHDQPHHPIHRTHPDPPPVPSLGTGGYVTVPLNPLLWKSVTTFPSKLQTSSSIGVAVLVPERTGLTL